MIFSLPFYKSMRIIYHTTARRDRYEELKSTHKQGCKGQSPLPGSGERCLGDSVKGPQPTPLSLDVGSKNGQGRACGLARFLIPTTLYNTLHTSISGGNLMLLRSPDQKSC